MRRDPRFDDLSGEFNETIYRSTYSFLGDVREREKKVCIPIILYCLLGIKCVAQIKMQEGKLKVNIYVS